MAAAMSRSEFAEGFAKFAEIPKYKSKDLTDLFLDYFTELFEKMDAGEKIILSGFGTFEKVHTSPRKIGDIKNGGTMMTTGKDKIVFKQSKPPREK